MQMAILQSTPILCVTNSNNIIMQKDITKLMMLFGGLLFFNCAPKEKPEYTIAKSYAQQKKIQIHGRPS